MVIFTSSYDPFRFGPPHGFIGTDVEVSAPFDIGAGYQARITVSPAGRLVVVEAETGAIIGGDPDQVKQDVASGDAALMAQQVSEAREQAKKARLVAPEEFWQVYGQRATRAGAKEQP